jgi:hypothetical protein
MDPLWNDIIMFLALVVLVAALATAPFGDGKPHEDEPSNPSEEG